VRINAIFIGGVQIGYNRVVDIGTVEVGIQKEELHVYFVKFTINFILGLADD